LDLLRHIASTIDENKPANSKAAGKQADASMPPDAPGWNDWDPELVMKWQRLRGPESPDLQRLCDNFLRFCEGNSLFWFSPKNKNIPPMFGPEERLPVQELTPAQQLRRYWPQSLGSTGKEGTSWTFLTEAAMGLDLRWCSYNDEGDPSRIYQSVCLYCAICIYGWSEKFPVGTFGARGRGPFH
jgi:hypothetical protein